MSLEESVLADHYTEGKPFVRVKIAVINPENLKQTTIEETFWIDTGFDGGVHVSQFHEKEATDLGVKVYQAPVAVAGGKIDPANHCLAYLQKIGDLELPAPGIEAEMIFHGQNPRGLIGLDILKNWIVKLDGPAQFLRITRPKIPVKH